MAAISRPSIARWSCRETPSGRHRRERGATLPEYGLLLGLIVSISLGAIGTLSGRSGSYLEETGNDIGTARAENELLDDDLPDEPEWLDAPGPINNDGEQSENGADDRGRLARSFSGVSSGLCFTANPIGATGSPIGQVPCDSSSPSQTFVAASSDLAQTPIQFASEVAGNLCISSTGGAGSTVVQNSCDGSTSQQWKVERATAIVVRSSADPTLCMDERAGSLTLEPCDFSPTQLFTK